MARSNAGGRAEAETTAIAALSWIATDQQVLGRFLAASGAGLEDIRAGALDPDFLGFVLDFLLSEESLVIGFAAAMGIAPDAPARARVHLPGGDLPAWT